MTDRKSMQFDLDDPRSGKIANVMGSKTAKKILNILAEGEKSSSEVAEELNMPLNTISYNLKKLVGAGLVNKSKKFFWSQKGKRIELYSLSNRRIVISPKRLAGNVLAGVLGILIVAIAAIAIISMQGSDLPQVQGGQLKQFNSLSEIREFVGASVDTSRGWGLFKTFGADASVSVTQESAGAAVPESADDFSTTNVQVEGVDEADIVKNDGEFIYVATGGKVVIVDAFPADNMEILSEIDLEGARASNLYINGDKLIVLTSYGEPRVYIYDIEDRENPELENEIEFEGYYVNSRMIGDYVYIISSKYVNANRPEPPIYTVNGAMEEVAVRDIYYFDYPDSGYVFSSISAINVENGDFDSEVYLMGRSTNIFVSEDNIYLTYMMRIKPDDYLERYVDEVVLPVLPPSEDEKISEIMDSNDLSSEKMRDVQEVLDDYLINTIEGAEELIEEFQEKLEDFQVKIQKETERTVINKIKIDKDDIEFKARGEVSGRVLNQFSMDEYDGYFRVATTTGHVSRTGGATSLNHLYVLDEDLDIVGSVEGLAEGERIYSTRFMGERAYIVTFKKVDPLFVIDLSNPRNPEVLGYLKITGYSDYLHPYDENHVIGVGKETRGGGESFSWYQGIKISLFDVSDVENPVERAKIEIGDRGTDSYALHDHKAFLFDKERNLLVIPIALAEIDESRYGREIPDNAYGETVWQGAYVLDISLDGIEVRGKITHYDEGDEIGRWYSGGGKAIQRSLYMDDILYTISNSMVKANDLDKVEEINFVELGYAEPGVIYETAVLS